MQERASLPPSEPEDMPPSTVELTLIGALARAHMATLKPKERRVFLAELMRVFAEYEDTSNVIRLRSREHDAAVTRSRRGAVAWTRGMIAAFFMLDVEKV